MEYGGVTLEQIIKAIDELGGIENLNAWLSGKKKATLKDVIPNLIDQIGRGLPENLEITASVGAEDRQSNVEQPMINYAEILALYGEFFPPGTGFLSTTEFEDRSESAKQRLSDSEIVSNLFRRTHLPLPIPQHVVNDQGKSLREFFLPALKTAYPAQFPNREFICQHNLSGQVFVFPDVGQENFLAAMAEKPNIGWYFPLAMQGFSIAAQRQAMKILRPLGFSLAGVIEHTLALVGFSKYLARDWKTPKLDCSAIFFKTANDSLVFRAGDRLLGLDYLSANSEASSNHSGGLVYLG